MALPSPPSASLSTPVPVTVLSSYRVLVCKLITQACLRNLPLWAAPLPFSSALLYSVPERRGISQPRCWQYSFWLHSSLWLSTSASVIIVVGGFWDGGGSGELRLQSQAEGCRSSQFGWVSTRITQDYACSKSTCSRATNGDSTYPPTK